MQQSFDTIYLDASAESWEPSGESARPGASFGDLLDLYGDEKRKPAALAEQAPADTSAESAPKLK